MIRLRFQRTQPKMKGEPRGSLFALILNGQQSACCSLTNPHVQVGVPRRLLEQEFGHPDISDGARGHVRCKS